MGSFGKKQTSFLKHNDLAKPGGGWRTANCVIDAVHAESFTREGKTDEFFSLSFVGKELKMHLNLGNQEVLIEAYGEPALPEDVSREVEAAAFSRHLHGKPITIWVDGTVRNPRTGEKGGLRLMAPATPQRPPGPPLGVEPPPMTPDSPVVPVEPTVPYQPPTEEPPPPEGEWSSSAPEPGDDDIPF